MGIERKTEDIPEVEVTPEMADLGGRIILAEPGVADYGVFFSAPDLAAKVYEAMQRLRPISRDLSGR
jgi:hypothetical protein